MLFVSISLAAVAVIGVAKSVKAVSVDGYGRIPTRTY